MLGDGGGNSHFNPLPPHGGRLYLVCTPSVYLDFNPLPPHGGRQIYYYHILPRKSFQSTPSAWRETDNYPYFDISTYISIHSLRMEGDADTCHNVIDDACISIHSLRMEGDLRITDTF